MSTKELEGSLRFLRVWALSAV